MELEGGKKLYFVFSGNQIKDLDLSSDDIISLSVVGVAGYIKTTGEKLEIIRKNEEFYFLQGNKSPYKKEDHLIVATYEFFTEFYIDHLHPFGQSTWVAPVRQPNYVNQNYFAEACHY